MAIPRGAPALSLPKSWSKRVRSAVLDAISLARFAVTYGRAHAAGSRIARFRQRAKIDRIRQEVALLIEELRIKDARMARVSAPRRPHYPPVERLAILELRAARGWTAAVTAERLFVTPATIASWMQRLDEEGPGALVRTRQPVNKFPEFVSYIVRRLKVLCPSMGKARIAQVLCRAGLHLGTTTVARMLRDDTLLPLPAVATSSRRVRARRPNHVWHVDLTTVPTGAGLWTSWLPWALPQRWPFCWWIAVAVDHYSRRVMGCAVFESQPTSAAVRSFLDSAMRRARSRPRHMITDHGKQFTAKAFRRWCGRRGIRQRFGALGKYGSLAVVERFIRTLKSEGTRRLLVPLRTSAFEQELALFAAWYNGFRPHSSLDAATPDEIYHGRTPATLAPRHEPRRKWPRRAPCAGPRARVRGRRGVKVELRVSWLHDRKHLPIVELKRAA